MARTGAARAKTKRCLRIRFLSRPACIRKDTRPNAAGAYNQQNRRVYIAIYCNNQQSILLPVNVQINAEKNPLCIINSVAVLKFNSFAGLQKLKTPLLLP